MAHRTERVSVSLPVDVKIRLQHRAKREGISLSALMRDIVDDLIAEHDLMTAVAEIERRKATIR